MSSKPKYSYITSTIDLKRLVSQWTKLPAICIDLEFDKNHFKYGFNLCLIQIFDDKEAFLIDPLSQDLDVTVLFPLLEDSNCKKVCFAFSEDLRLFHSLGCFPKGLHDLTIAKSLLGLPPISLENILKEKLGIAPNKSQQKSNWFKRPLTEDQKRYAVEDVCYLPKLYDVIIKELQEKNRFSWFTEEMEFMENQDYSGENNYFAIPEKERKNFTTHEWMKYISLLEYREELAQNLNRPSFKVIDKNLLGELAKKQKSIVNWAAFKGIHPSLKNKKIQQKIKRILEDTENKIIKENIPNSTSVKRILSQEERIRISQLKFKLAQYKENVFQPLKVKLIEHYGEHFANFVLSNRIVEQLILSNRKLLPYQREIFYTLSKEIRLEHSTELLEGLFEK